MQSIYEQNEKMPKTIEITIIFGQMLALILDAQMVFL